MARLNVMLAHGRGCSWAVEAVDWLARLPVDIRNSESTEDALSMTVDGRVQVGVVDAALPSAGGLEFVRRIRRLGIALPCLLVSETVEPRDLQTALELDVLSVVGASACRWPIVRIVDKIGRQLDRLGWPDLPLGPGGMA